MSPLSIRIENGKFAIISTLIHVGANVLDVGCGTGELGEILRRTKKCVVTGIEIDPRALEVAKQKLNNVLKLNIETSPKLPFPEYFFDVIIFADVL